jgi:hypothetical protein
MYALLALHTSMFSTARWNCSDTSQLSLQTQPKIEVAIDTIRGETGCAAHRPADPGSNAQWWAANGLAKLLAARANHRCVTGMVCNPPGPQQFPAGVERC